MMKRFGWFGAASVIAAMALAGCGGGGGSTPPPGGRAVNVFATDDMNARFSHAWIKVYKVEVTNSAGQSLDVVLDDPNGRVMDVRSLRDDTGARFAFLGTGSLPPNASVVKVTLDPQVTVTDQFGTATVPFVNVDKDTQGRPVLSFSVEGAAGAMVVDFDLSKWTAIGEDPVTGIDPGKNSGGLHLGSETGLNDMNRHECEDYEGTVSQLSGTAPNFTFTLTMEHGSVTVSTDANTAVFNSDGSPNPQLANGQMVTVRGVFNASTSTLAAAEIKIHKGSMTNEHGVAGVTDSPNAQAGTFVVILHEADFLPDVDRVTVATNANTVFRGESGVILTAADFFARLAAGSQKVEAEGTYDASTKVLNANRVKIEQMEGHGGGGGDHSHDAEAKGTAVNANAVAGTFTINPMTEWEGFMGMGGSVNVTTNGSTVFKNLSDQTISAADFFSAIAGGTTHVKVEGTFSAGVITATKAELKP
ncbi:MAG: DUF5666 domain-containing protein [Chthonomonadales bacterium]